MSSAGIAIHRPLVGGGRHPSSDGRPEAIPARADGVELLGAVAGSGYRRPPALARRADGQTVQLTPLLYALLASVDGERGHDELAAALGEQVEKHVTADDVRFLVEAKLRPLGLLRGENGSAPVLAKPSPLLALRPKLVVSNPETTRRLTAPFASLFRPWIVVPVLVAFALTTWWVAFERGLASAAREALYRPSLILAVLGLTLLSAGFHEVGHAAACRYAGAAPGRMGVGLYLVWPAFYTEVSDSYRLGRGGRLRVDLGGLYFNAIFAVGTLGVWLLVRWDPLLLVVAAQPLQMVRQLVPFVRFDGYHVLADLVGVPDLFRHIGPTLLGLLPTRRSRTDGKALKTWARAVVTLWVLVVVPVLVALLVVMVVSLPRVVATAWDSLGLQWASLEAAWGRGDAATVAARVFSMLMVVLPVSGIVYLLVRVARRTARKTIRATAGRPLIRVGAAFACGALATGLAWAWWPHGGAYRPIGPTERGRVADVVRAPAASRAVAVQPVRSVVPAAQPPAVRRTAAPVPAASPRRAAPRRQWMLVFIPKRAPGAPPRPAFAVPLPARRGPDGRRSGPAPSAAVPPPVPVPTPVPAPSAGGDVAPVAPPAPPAEPASSPGWVFPFAPPPEPGPRDNQALAVNTTDGTSTYVVALSLVWVTDGGPVDERNTAYAAASCTGCSTVAVAFQVVFVIGYAQVVTPVSSAVAVNYQCNACVTGALAMQLAVTLTRPPGDSAMNDLGAVWAQLQHESAQMPGEPLAQVRAHLGAARDRMLEILAEDGALPPDAAGTSVSADSGAGTGAPTTTTETTPPPAPVTTTTTDAPPPTTTAVETATTPATTTTETTTTSTTTTTTPVTTTTEAATTPTTTTETATTTPTTTTDTTTQPTTTTETTTTPTTETTTTTPTTATTTPTTATTTPTTTTVETTADPPATP